MTPEMLPTTWQFFAAGVVGGLIGAQLRDGGIELPRLIQLKGATGIKLSLGGLIGLLAGGLAGVYFDHTLWNAATYGFAATVLLEQGASRLVGPKTYKEVSNFVEES